MGNYQFCQYKFKLDKRQPKLIKSVLHCVSFKSSFFLFHSTLSHTLAAKSCNKKGPITINTYNKGHLTLVILH